MRSRAYLFVLLALAPLGLWAVLPLVSSGDTGKAARIRSQIDSKQKQIDSKKRTEGVLTTDVTRISTRIHGVQANIDVLQQRQDTIQADLDRKQAQLDRTQRDLRAERAGLARLRARLVFARTVLARRLVELYKAGRPDIVTVILSSHGFADLLERGEFMRRISDQDARIIKAVRVAKVQAKIVSDRLAKLEATQRRITSAVTARRNEVAGVRLRLVGARAQGAGARAPEGGGASQVRGQRKQLEGSLSSLRREQARIQGTLRNSGAGFHGGGGSGRLIWPVNGPITSYFCERRSWEGCHPGIDIGVPSGTPIKAADGGRIALASYTGGYGNYTCIQHTSTLSTCYGHQSSFAVSGGQRVSQGQVIGYTGCTGLCFGAHLHFEVRVNGSVVNPLDYLG